MAVIEWTHHAVSSMKMPSLSSCMNSSPPGLTHRNYQLTSFRSKDETWKTWVGRSVGSALCLTTQILQDEIQLSTRLKGIDEVHYERMLHLLQDVSLSFGVCCVLGITHNHGLAVFKTIQCVNHLKPMLGSRQWSSTPGWDQLESRLKPRDLGNISSVRQARTARLC